MHRRGGEWSGERFLAFALAAGVPALLALSSGGYDLVVRQGWGLAVWAAIALGLAVGVLPRAIPARAALVPLGALGALAAVTALGLIGTPSDERTVAELARVVGMGGLIALAWLGLGPRTWSAACAGLTTGAAAITLLALASRLAPAAFPPNPLVDLLGSDRLFYPLGYWNAVAAWAAITAVALVAWSLQGRPRWPARLALAAVPPSILALYLTLSRGGLLALAVGAIVLVLLSRNRGRAAVHLGVAVAISALPVLVARAQPEIADGTGAGGGAAVLIATLAAAALCSVVPRMSRSIGSGTADVRRRRRTTARLIVAVVGAVVAIGLLSGAAYRAWDQFTGGEPVAAAGADPSERLTSVAGDRYAYWSEGIAAFRSEPLAGVGPGTFGFWWRSEGDPGERVLDAHSVFVEHLAELGLPGFLALSTLLVGSLWAGLRPHPAPRRPAAALAATSSFCAFLAIAAIDWIWEFAALGALAFAGVAAAGAAGSSELSRSRARRAAQFPRWLRLAAVAGALAAAAVQVPGLVSTQLVRGSAQALAAGDLERALVRADDAIAAAPWAAAPYAQRARVRARGGELAAARADALEAVEREPLEPRHRALARALRNRLAR